MIFAQFKIFISANLCINGDNKKKDKKSVKVKNFPPRQIYYSVLLSRSPVICFFLLYQKKVLTMLSTMDLVLSCW